MSSIPLSGETRERLGAAAIKMRLSLSDLLNYVLDGALDAIEAQPFANKQYVTFSQPYHHPYYGVFDAGTVVQIDDSTVWDNTEGVLVRDSADPDPFSRFMVKSHFLPHLRPINVGDCVRPSDPAVPALGTILDINLDLVPRPFKVRWTIDGQTYEVWESPFTLSAVLDEVTDNDR